MFRRFSFNFLSYVRMPSVPSKFIGLDELYVQFGRLVSKPFPFKDTPDPSVGSPRLGRELYTSGVGDGRSPLEFVHEITVSSFLCRKIEDIPYRNLFSYLCRGSFHSGKLRQGEENRRQG